MNRRASDSLSKYCFDYVVKELRLGGILNIEVDYLSK